MPLYNYQCEACGREFEVLVGVGTGEESLKCTACGNENIQRKFAAFKVSGSFSISTSDSTSPSSVSSCSTCSAKTCYACGM